MTTGDDLWRDEWLAELSGELRGMRGVIDSLAANPSDPSPWRRLERAWSRLAGQAAFFGESAMAAIGVEAASLCERVARKPGIAAPDEVADALARAIDLIDGARRTDDARTDPAAIDELLATLRALAPASDPACDLRRLMGQARMLIDAWRADVPVASGALAERVSALESACDDIARGRAPEETMPEAHRASTARVSSEIPDDWRRGVEQLATLRDELRDEHVSPRILGRFDAILRRLGAPIRAAAGVSDGTLHVLCARVGDRRFAIPKNVIAAVRPARRAPTSRFAGEDVFPIRLDDTDAPTDDIDLPTDDTDTTTDDIDPPTDDTDTTTDDIMLHVIVETGRGRVAIGVTEVTGEATLWNVGPNSSGDPRFLRVGIDADEREWEILDVAALAPSSHAVEGGQDDDGALVAANGRPRPNAAPLLRALSRGDGR